MYCETFHLILIGRKITLICYVFGVTPYRSFRCNLELKNALLKFVFCSVYIGASCVDPLYKGLGPKPDFDKCLSLSDLPFFHSLIALSTVNLHIPNELQDDLINATICMLKLVILLHKQAQVPSKQPDNSTQKSLKVNPP